jgi:hypothetical protein
MDAFVQHLGSKRMQLRTVYKSGRHAEAWLREEFYFLLDYLRYVNKFRNFIGRLYELSAHDPYITSHGEEGSVVFIRGKKTNTWMELAYFSTQWDLAPHLVDVQKKLEKRSTMNDQDLRLFVQIVICQGKWANKAIEDCILRIQDTAGIRFERYAPELILTLYNEYNDPLDENAILRLFFAYI